MGGLLGAEIDVWKVVLWVRDYPISAGPLSMVGRPSGGSSRTCLGWVWGIFALRGANISLIRGWPAHGGTSPSQGSPKAGPGLSSPRPPPGAAIRCGRLGRWCAPPPPPSESSVSGGPPRCKSPPPPCRGVRAGGEQRRCRGGGAYGGCRHRRPRAPPRPACRLAAGGGGGLPDCGVSRVCISGPSLTQGGTGKALLVCGDMEPYPGPRFGGMLPLTLSTLALLALPKVVVGHLWLWAAQPAFLWPPVAPTAPFLCATVHSC